MEPPDCCRKFLPDHTEDIKSSQSQDTNNQNLILISSVLFFFFHPLCKIDHKARAHTLIKLKLVTHKKLIKQILIEPLSKLFAGHALHFNEVYRNNFLCYFAESLLVDR